MSDPHLAQTNARIAEMYDYAPWIDGPMPWLKLDWLLGVSRLYGIGHNVKDVLDLGCGGGGAICHMGDQVDGRLVGVDISPVSCQVARDRMAGFEIGRAHV